MISSRSGKVLTTPGADELFAEVLSNVEALVRLAEPPLTTAMAVARLKRYLADPLHRIDLHDLIMAEGDRVAEEVASQPVSLPSGADAQWLESLYGKHLDAARPLLKLLAVGVWHDDHLQHQRLWIDVLQRLIDAGTRSIGQSSQGLDVARLYPALLASSVMGLVAVHRDREDLVLDPARRSECARTSDPSSARRVSVPPDILINMVRKMTPAQFKATVNKAQRQQKQAIDNYNREARRHNAAVKKAVSDYNREVRAYNAKARAHNAKVENQRRRLNQEIRCLNSRPATATFVTYRASVETLARTYTETEQSLVGRTITPAGRDLVDRGSEEAANSVYLLNAMDGDGAAEEDPTEGELRGPSMQAELATFGEDLVDRWTGALFSLSPSNPDAARHFCTSAREVLITMIDSAAPDSDVAEADPACDRTDKGVPTRRAKVGFLLRRKGIDETPIEDLVEEDMDNVLGLFREFNNGTHGHAGRFTITQLSALRIRVESAIGFIHALCAI